MYELLLGSSITIISILIGFHLRGYQGTSAPDIKQKINDIFTRIVPNPEVGPVIRPTAQEVYYRDNPQARIENEEMEKTFDKII